MKLLTLDFETYFNDKYNVKKMTTEEYIRDPRFSVLCAGVIIEGHSFKGRFNERQFREFSRDFDWQDTGVIAHHAHFEALILARHYNVLPAFWFCPLSMARLHFGGLRSAALANLAGYYGCEAKSVDYDTFRGRDFYDLEYEDQQALMDQCYHDTELARIIFLRMMADGFPPAALKIINTTVKMFSRPKLIGNVPMYEQIALDEFQSKNAKRHALGVSKEDLMSNEKFANLLRAEGIEVELKQGKNGMIPAVAKSDNFMQELANSDNPHIAALVEARQENKSAINETRAARIAEHAARGPICIYLGPFAANTLRWGGGDKINWQNMPRRPRGQPKPPEGPPILRDGISVPPRCLLGVVDKSQIEYRLLMATVKQENILEELRNGEDPYARTASEFYGRTITKADEAERGLGKQIELSCGYGAGYVSIQSTARRGTYGPSIILSDEESKSAQGLYKERHDRVKPFWKECDGMILPSLAKGIYSFDWVAGCRIEGKRIVGPNGLYMIYELQWDVENHEWQRKTRYGYKKIWGGTVTQNLMEFLAMIDLSENLNVLERHGVECACVVHDEGWFVHPEETAQARHELCVKQFGSTPWWLPDMPAAAEGHLGVNYAK